MKKMKIKEIRSGPYQPVADIEVMNDNHYLLDNGIISHNSGFIFAATIIITMNKYKLKVDEEGTKISDTRGIRSKIKVAKSRYSKPFEEIEVHIPYDTGLSPYSGLYELFMSSGVLVKDGIKYAYNLGQPDEIKLLKKEWLDFENSAVHYQKIMTETDDREIVSVTSDGEETEAED